MPTPAETPCPRCGHIGLEVGPKMRARPIGSFSLAGQQMKVSARLELRWWCPQEDCPAEGPAEAS